MMAEEGDGEPNRIPTIVGAVDHDGPHRMTSPPAVPGHEMTLPVNAWVQPASYLRRPRGLSRPMPPAKQETAVDREQRRGLVRLAHWPFLWRSILTMSCSKVSELS